MQLPMKHLFLILLCLFGALMAFGQDPVLKPLDKVRVTCEEEPQLNREYIVTNDGLLLMNFIGAIRVAGKTEVEAARVISDELVRQKIVKTATVTVKLVGSGSKTVRYSGAVKNFGEMPWRDGLRLAEVVRAAEPTNLADLARVRIEAADGRRLEINFAKWDGTDGSVPENPTLKPGDHVVFPRATISANVFVLGGVVRPGTVEFKAGMTLSEAVEAAGGVTLEGNTERVRFTRQGARERVLNLANDGGEVLRAGDRIFVEPKPRGETVFLTGGVKRPGLQAFENGLTLMKAIERSGGFTSEWSPPRIKVIRREGQRQRTINVDVKKIVEGFSGDFALMAGDRIEIPKPRAERGQNRGLAVLGIIIGIFLIGG